MIRTSTPNFPSHNDSNKNEKWIKDFIKACWEDFTSIETNSFYAGRLRYSNIAKYMIGEQDPAVYRRILDLNSANTDKSWLKSSPKILPIIPKYRRMAISSLVKNRYGIEIQAIDPTSVEEKTEYYAQNKARLMLREQMKANGLDPNMIPKPEGDYENEEDLDLYMEYSYKNRIAIEAEQAIKVVLNNNKFDFIREEAISQLHDLGFIGYKEFFDQNGDIKVEFVDVRDVVVSRCKRNDFSDAIYKGRVLDVTIADLKQLDSNCELTKADFDLIQKRLGQRQSSFNLSESVNPRDYENERIQVLDIEFYSTNEYVMEKGLDKNGNPTVSRKGKDYKKKKGNEYYKKEYKVVYEGKWVVGTDIYFGCQLQTNMKRANTNISDVSMSLHFFAPMLYNMETKSMGENYIPIADQIQIAWMKYQDVIVRAKKSGIAIEIGALENIPLGKGGKMFTPMDGIDFYNKTGNLVYRRLDEEGKNASYKPIEELRNGLGTEAAAYFSEIQNNISLLQQLSGYNEITDGSTPDSRTLNGVAKLASESTNNSIDFMKRAEKLAFESLMHGIMIRIQDAAKNGNLKGYINALGKSSIEFFKLSPEVSSRELGLIIQDAPSEFKKQALQDRINIAIQDGQITIADAYAIENVPNVKHAEALLSIRIKKNLEKQQQIAMQNQEMNAKLQRESAEQAAQMKQQEVQMKSQAKILEIKAQEESTLRIQEDKYNREEVLEIIKSDGRVRASDIQGKSKDYASDTQRRIKEAELEANKETKAKEELQDA